MAPVRTPISKRPLPDRIAHVLIVPERMAAKVWAQALYGPRVQAMRPINRVTTLSLSQLQPSRLERIARKRATSGREHVKRNRQYSNPRSRIVIVPIRVATFVLDRRGIAACPSMRTPSFVAREYQATVPPAIQVKPDRAVQDRYVAHSNMDRGSIGDMLQARNG